jgi:hypothetical protein
MRAPFEVLRDRLAVYLGPHTARTALKTFADRAVGGAVTPEQMTAAQARKLLEALRPMLKTLVGAAQCERIISQLGVELELHA